MSIRVLVADDSGTMRKHIIRSLKVLGVTDVVQAGDGAETLSLFGEMNVQLLLLDWNMPEKDGLEVLQEIRAQGSDVPVMMVTTEADKSRVLAAIQAGATDYLVKPFTADLLRQKLEQHCASVDLRV